MEVLRVKGSFLMLQRFQLENFCSTGFPGRNGLVCGVVFLLIGILSLSGCLDQTMEMFTVVAREETGSSEWDEEQARLEAEKLELLRLEEEARLWEEREKLEKERKEQMAFYVPLPPLGQEKPRCSGIYLTGHSVGMESRYRNLLVI